MSEKGAKGRPRGLRRLPNPERTHYADDLVPGWFYIKRRRDWSLRGYTRGAQHQWSPLTWWEARYRGKVKFEEQRLADAVAKARAAA